MEFFIVQLL